MNTKQIFVNEIKAFLKKHKMAPSAFGRQAVNDSKLVQTLFAGRSPTTDLVDKVKDFMREYND